MSAFHTLLINPDEAVNPLTQSKSRQFLVTRNGEDALVHFLNHIFVEAANNTISDVHFRDNASHMTVRYRIAGRLRDMYYVARQTSHDIDNKVRARSKLDPTERIAPLDGKFWFDLGDRMLDVRVSIMPTRHGQTIVCRLLDQANAGRSIADVTMSDPVRACLMRALHQNEGMVLVTGPTGSGKTTTLYAALNYLNKPDIHIVTAEDPIEYDLPGASQVQAEGHLRSFARILRSFLRQDFEVGLVGEIRDGETAAVSVQAANTGHLILSTLHTNDGPSTLIRLADMGVERFGLGSALRAIVAQRLEERLCPHCAVQHELTPQEAQQLEKLDYPLEGPFWRRNNDGCAHCQPQTIQSEAEEFSSIGVKPGYRGPFGEKGRVPVVSIIENTKRLRRAIQYNQQDEIMPAILDQPQYRSLALTGLDLCVQKTLDFHRALRLSESET
ncbi:general secretory pathway protein E [Burkholderia gladioli]|uniref:General secretory pathway protein E n=1 Tax=Burkholderia gladioli TaxID=28095 RepID=A0A2A7SAU1_BURGA|nr:ATPase, T2SS/T4P/T4SS family [Burkholderia gladioli]PEH40425.1 general secretory pathway protein E [Burkholderia gladioli]